MRNAAYIGPVPNYDCGEPSQPTSQIPHLYYWNVIGLKDIFGRPLPLTCAVHIARVYETKARMLACHVSQREWLRVINNCDNCMELMRRMAEAQGRAAGRELAEGFHLHRGEGHPQDNVLKQLLGLIVFHWINVMHAAPPLENPDEAFPFALRHLAPDWGLRGIILADFLAAVMSIISALANSTVTIFSLEVYKRMFHPDADDARLVRMGRIASLASMAIAALVAPSVAHLGGVFRYFQNGATYLATLFISVMLLGFLWKRANRQGAMFGLIGGSAITLAMAFGAPAIGIKLHWLYLAAIAQAITMVGIVIVSLLTPAPAESLWRPFHWTLAALKQYDDGVRRPWYQSVLLWWTLYIVVWVYLYCRFW